MDTIKLNEKGFLSTEKTSPELVGAQFHTAQDHCESCPRYQKPYKKNIDLSLQILEKKHLVSRP